MQPKQEHRLLTYHQQDPNRAKKPNLQQNHFSKIGITILVEQKLPVLRQEPLHQTQTPNPNHVYQNQNQNSVVVIQMSTAVKHKHVLSKNPSKDRNRVKKQSPNTNKEYVI